MRTRPLFLAILVLAATPAVAGDFAITYERAKPTFGKPLRTVLHQHGQRMRFDDVGQSGEVTQTFTTPGQTAKFEVVRRADGTPRVVSLIEDPAAAPAPNAKRTYSGETRTLLGQACQVWKASFTPTLLQTGCTSADGVELFFQDMPYGERTAVSIERTKVAAKAVTPPIEWLDLATWAPVSTQDHSHDYRVRLGLIDMRRSGSWVRVDETQGAMRTTRLTDTATGVIFTYTTSGPGRRQLTIERNPAAAAFTGDAMARLNSVIQGQTCRWWDMTALVMDFSEQQCRTAGGAILSIERSTRGADFTLQAATYEDLPQSWTSIAPEREIASPTAWGL